MAEKAKKDKAKAPSAQYGVLFVHYGLPSDIEDKTLRPFMRRILLDKRVRTLPLPLWLPKMQFSILGPAVQELKREISSFWNGESTYQKNCNRQRRAIALDIEDLGMANVVTASVSRYGKPGIREGLQHLTESGAKRIVVVPMAPQSSYTFTASVHDAWKKEKRRFSSDVEYRFIDNFYDDEWYIEALANNILDTVERLRPQGTAGKHRIPEVNATGSLSALDMLAKKHKLVFVYRTALCATSKMGTTTSCRHRPPLSPSRKGSASSATSGRSPTCPPWRSGAAMPLRRPSRRRSSASSSAA